jgi:hypothetical protein
MATSFGGKVNRKFDQIEIIGRDRVSFSNYALARLLNAYQLIW